MPDDSLARVMLDTAKRDLRALGNMLDSELFDDEVFGFHAQQAAEKALKAWLIVLSGSHPYTHDLGRLLHEIQQAGADVEAYWNTLELTNYAIRFRYEAIPAGNDPLDRPAMLRDIQVLVAHVSEILERTANDEV